MYNLLAELNVSKVQKTKSHHLIDIQSHPDANAESLQSFSLHLLLSGAAELGFSASLQDSDGQTRPCKALVLLKRYSQDCRACVCAHHSRESSWGQCASVCCSFGRFLGFRAGDSTVAALPDTCQPDRDLTEIDLREVSEHELDQMCAASCDNPLRHMLDKQPGVSENRIGRFTGGQLHQFPSGKWQMKSGSPLLASNMLLGSQKHTLCDDLNKCRKLPMSDVLNMRLCNMSCNSASCMHGK